MPRGDARDSDPTPGSRGASLSQFYSSIVLTVLMKLRKIMPAEVVSYTAPVPGQSPALVTIQPHFHYARIIDNPDEKTPENGRVVQRRRFFELIAPLPEVQRVPVHYPGHSRMRIQGPLEPGEVGLYLVCDRSLDEWINLGGPRDPGVAQLHDISDGIFLPGLRSGNIAQDIPDGVDTVGREDGTAGLSIDRETKSLALATDGPEVVIDAATLIKLGEAAALGVARLNDSVTTSAALDLFQAQVITALTTIAAAVPVVIVPPTPTTAAGTITTASTDVQAE